jgi:beta-lactamase superfamily II metal-dependent hydrolase
MTYLVNLYAQHIFRDTTSRRYRAIFDVENAAIHRELDSVWQPEPANSSAPNTASMISLDFPTDSLFKPREGSWYEVDAKSIADADTRIRLVRSNEQGASYIRTALIATAPLQFKAELIDPLNAELPSPANTVWPEMKDDGLLNLTVVDCGQGNWNEVSNSEVRLIFDTGADRYFTPREISRFIKARRLSEGAKRILILISHWDIDHFHALLRFRPCDLDKVSAVIGPSKIPKTETFNKVHELLAKNKVPLYAVPFAARPISSSRRISLIPLPIAPRGVIRVFRSTRGASRNQTGIVVTAHGKSKTAVLTGDHHYEKILDAIAPYCRTAPCVLVAPHHGGRAGELDTARWKSTLSIDGIPISVGRENPFGHPLNDITSKLTSLSGSIPWETRERGTYTEQLS